MTDLPRHSVSVTGIVRDDGRVLAIKRHDDGRWVPPGGVLELNETPQDGVAREVYEETGLKVQPVRLSGVYKNMRLGVVSLAFVCEVTGGEDTPQPRPTASPGSPGNRPLPPCPKPAPSA